MHLDVMCVGAATMDTIAVVGTIPAEDERTVASAFIQAGGGPAATAAVALARLGVHVGFCGAVGDDAAGHQVVEGLAAEGVDVSAVVFRPGAATTTSIVLVSEATAKRTIITGRGLALEASDIPVDRADWFHVDQSGFAPVREALRNHTGGARLSVDAGNPIDTPALSGIDLYAPTILALTDRYSLGAPEELVKAAHEDGAGMVVATDGSAGSFVADGDTVAHIPAFPIDVVSTLGAGDVFHGALLARLIQGEDLTTAVRDANAVAALSCLGIDGRSAIPDLPQLEDFLAAQVRGNATDQNGSH